MHALLRRAAIALICASAATSGCHKTVRTAAASAEVATADEAPDPDYIPTELTIPVPADAFAKDADVLHKGDTLALAANSAPGAGQGQGSGTRYFMTVYGYQRTGPLNLPKFTHSWALFIAADGPDPATAPLQTITISWDAADGDIGFAQLDEPGHNYTMAETFALASKLGSSIRRSRIVEVTPALAERALRQWQKLEKGQSSGLIRYKMTDDMPARSNVAKGLAGYLNCQHALTDIIAVPGPLVETGLKRGWEASDYAFNHLAAAPWGIAPDKAWDSILAPRLNI